MTGTTAPAALLAAEPAQLGTFAVTALAPGTKGPLTVEVADPEGEGAAERFRLVVKDGGKAVETFDVSAKKGTRSYVVTQVKEQSKLISVTEAAPTGQLARPENQTVTPAAPPTAPAERWAPRPRRTRRTPAPPSTSVTPPTAPASAAWRRWTRSPWSPSPT
ncbi:phage tail sheath N-terminal beta-sandwich domain-containing protein [Actinomadura keratinilytica]